MAIFNSYVQFPEGTHFSWTKPRTKPQNAGGFFLDSVAWLVLPYFLSIQLCPMAISVYSYWTRSQLRSSGVVHVIQIIMYHATSAFFPYIYIYIYMNICMYVYNTVILVLVIDQPVFFC